MHRAICYAHKLAGSMPRSVMAAGLLPAASATDAADEMDDERIMDAHTQSLALDASTLWQISAQRTDTVYDGSGIVFKSFCTTHSSRLWFYHTIGLYIHKTKFTIGIFVAQNLNFQIHFYSASYRRTSCFCFSTLIRAIQLLFVY